MLAALAGASDCVIYMCGTSSLFCEQSRVAVGGKACWDEQACGPRPPLLTVWCLMELRVLWPSLLARSAAAALASLAPP